MMLATHPPDSLLYSAILTVHQSSGQHLASTVHLFKQPRLPPTVYHYRPMMLQESAVALEYEADPTSTVFPHLQLP